MYANKKYEDQWITMPVNVPALYPSTEGIAKHFYRHIEDFCVLIVKLANGARCEIWEIAAPGSSDGFMVVYHTNVPGHGCTQTMDSVHEATDLVDQLMALATPGCPPQDRTLEELLEDIAWEGLDEDVAA